MTCEDPGTGGESQAVPVRDDNPYAAAPNAIAPHSMYFYYMIPGMEDDLSDAEVRSYFFDNVSDDGKPYPITDVLATVRYLAVNARDDLDWPPRISGGIGDVKWRQKSYIVFLIASRTIKFKHHEGIKVKGNGSYGMNHAFYDGFDRDIEIDFPGTGLETMNMFCCTNHICDPDGKNLGNRVQDKIYFRLQFEGFAALFLPDSGGTNMGPPVSPPAIIVP
jgi:hypothetical protein